MPGRAGIPRKVCKTGEAPRPRGGQDAIRGKLLGESAVFPPEVPRHGDGSFPPSAKRVARLGGAAGGCAPSAALRAARGRGNKPIFAFLHWEYPLPELSVTRLARGRFFGLSPHKYRAPRHKRHTVSATQTIRFNVPASAYNGVFANATNARGNRFLPPRHSLSVGAGRGIPGRGCKFAPANLAPSLRG